MEKKKQEKPEILFLAEDFQNRYSYVLNKPENKKENIKPVLISTHQTVTENFTPLNNKRGGYRKTRNKLIEDDKEYILWDKHIKISFDYTNVRGDRTSHKISMEMITGTKDGTPVYILGRHYDEEDGLSIDRLTFKLDRMTLITFKKNTFNNIDTFLKTLK